MYSMKAVCKETNLPYETLKFYCNEGLVPNVKRNGSNYRIFDDKDIAWIKSLSCLKRCGMSIAEMKQYLELCLQGEKSIQERKTILSQRKKQLLSKLQELNDCIEYIDTKQKFYDDVLLGKIPYESNLIAVPKEEY